MWLGPGTQVTPNVRLLELLGEGGMGSVWVAEHAGLKTRVAVKFVSRELVERDPSLIERFNREAALTAKIKSPHVIQTFDHGVMPDGQAYIVMELLEGEALSDRLERDGRLSPEETCLVVQQTAKGLSRAHKMGVVHRDIKPENLFLVDDDDGLFVKILDFGIAKQTSLPLTQNVTGTNMMVGTPEYMSPEQVMSAKDVSAQADLWSLSVVAYRCLTGGVPFSGETVGALAVAIANGIFTPPRTFRRELRPGVDDWFARALAKHEEARFGDAKELARTFAAAILGAEALLSLPDLSGPHSFDSAITALGAIDPSMRRDDEIPTAEIVPAVARGPSSPTFSGATLASDRTKSRRTVVALSIGGIAVAAVAVAAIAASAFGPELAGPSSAAPPDAAAAPSTTDTAANAEVSDSISDVQEAADLEIAEPPPETPPTAQPSAAPIVVPPPRLAPPKPKHDPPEPTTKDRGF
jgi:eukaryotic-like serine/threonine-protein kinase